MKTHSENLENKKYDDRKYLTMLCLYLIGIANVKHVDNVELYIKKKRFNTMSTTQTNQINKCSLFPRNENVFSRCLKVRKKKHIQNVKHNWSVASGQMCISFPLTATVHKQLSKATFTIVCFAPSSHRTSAPARMPSADLPEAACTVPIKTSDNKTYNSHQTFTKKTVSRCAVAKANSPIRFVSWNCRYSTDGVHSTKVQGKKRQF